MYTKARCGLVMIESSYANHKFAKDMRVLVKPKKGDRITVTTEYEVSDGVNTSSQGI